MAYIEAEVVIHGAREEITLFFDGDEQKLGRWLKKYRDWAHQNNTQVSIFIIGHNHPLLGQDEECFCAQYVTDHHPMYIFKPEQA